MANQSKTSPIPFELLASYNESVALLGNWNDWEPLPMEKDDRGIWRAEVPLADGDYEYKFQVISKSFFAAGETRTVADPKALEHTLDSHENAIVRVRNGQRITLTYEWQHDDKPLPPNEQLILYELHVGDFSGTSGADSGKIGTFADLIDRLKLIKLQMYERARLELLRLRVLQPRTPKKLRTHTNRVMIISKPLVK